MGTSVRKLTPVRPYWAGPAALTARQYSAHVIDVLSKAAALVLIIVIGYAIKRRGWVDGSAVGIFGKILLNITLPAAIITSFNTVEIRPDMLSVIAVGAGAVLVGLVVGFVVHHGQDRRAQAQALLSVAPFNIGLFAIPYLSTFVGPEGILIAGLFDIGNGLASITVGYTGAVLLARGGGEVRTGRLLLKTVLQPVFVCYVTMVALRLAGLQLPSAITGFTSIVGAANTFLAMLMIGIGLEIVLDRSRYAAAARILVTRYVVMVPLAFAVWFLLPLTPLEKGVIIMIFAAPIASMSAAFSAELDLDIGIATFAISASVIVSIIAMPFVGMLTG